MTDFRGSIGPLIYIGGLLLFVADAAENVNVLIATAIVGFLTVFIQQIFAGIAAKRQHEWDMADRKEKAEELRLNSEAQVKLIAAQSEATQRQIALVMEQRALAIEARTIATAKDVKKLEGMVKENAERIDAHEQQQP